MSITTHDPILEKVVRGLLKKFPNRFIHGECTRDTYPENFQRIYIEQTAVIIYSSDYGNLKNCIHYCRESEIIRLKNKKNNQQ